MKKLILITLTFIMFNTIKAQDFKVIEASQRTWKTYMCCQYGIFYDITIESEDTLQTYLFDTLWYGNEYFAQYQSKFYTLTRNIVDGKLRYYFHISLSWDNNAEDNFDENVYITPPEYNGVACIFYQTEKRRRRIDINEIIVTPPIGSL